MSAASRNGIGVGRYPVREAQLAYVLRPQASLDWFAYKNWFDTVDGQGYDWWGLLRFVWLGDAGWANNGKMFCSEFLARAYRYLGVPVFNPAEDADAIAPFEFLTSPSLTIIAIPSSLGASK